MAWLNLNDSLNQIKGQITSFASGVLTDGILNDTDTLTDISEANKKIEELKSLCASHEAEIATLRGQRAESNESNSQYIPKNDVRSNNKTDENWFWDPSDSSKNVAKQNATESEIISDLKAKIIILENEKKDLNAGLEQLDVDCQETTDKLVTLKDALQLEVNDLKVSYDNVKLENNALLQEKRNATLQQSEVNKLKLENDALRKQQTEINHTGHENRVKSLQDELDEKSSILSNLQERYQRKCTDKESIEKEFENFKQDKEVELISLQNELRITKKKLDKFIRDKKNQEDVLRQRENVLGELEERNKAIETEKQKLELYLKTFEKLQEEHESLQQKYHELENGKNKSELLENRGVLEELHMKLREAESEINALKNSSPTESEKTESSSDDGLHKKYVNALTETMKKYLDYEVSADIVIKPSDDKNITEFNAVVEVFLKLLLDFKWKGETLERQLCDVTQEKTKIVAEKNYEIEKLLQNSEILSQEVITKSQTMKQYEYECSELIKNNDVLISELQNYKNSSGLQTISESNEDNLLLLEGQLEGANKRIKDLELIISDMENAKQDDSLETQTELEYIKKQLNMTGRELSQSKKENQELSLYVKQKEVDNSALRNELSHLKSAHETSFEKMKLDYENAEYKFTETNVNYETVKEDLDRSYKEKEELTNSLKNFENLHHNTENKMDSLLLEICNLKTQLCNEEEIRKEKDQQIRNFEEKLQNAKMSETSLKLQYDTMHKELLYSRVQLEESKKCIESLKQEMQSLILQSDDLKTTLMQKNVTLTADLVTSNEKYDALVKQQEGTSNLQTEERNIQLLKQDLLGHQNRANESALEIADLTNKLADTETARIAVTEDCATAKMHLEVARNENAQLLFELELVKREQKSNVDDQKLIQLEKQINELNDSKNQVIEVLKSKHEENVHYHNEIQRLGLILNAETEKCFKLEEELQSKQQPGLAIQHIATLEAKTAEIEKLVDQNNFLREKCEVLAENLLQEQSNTQKVLTEKSSASEREVSLSKELERLRVHLVEIEDSYTQELLQAEQRNQEMLTKVNEIELREKNSSTIYTSVSIRANQQVETLQTQLQLITAQRDEIQKRISDAEDKNHKQLAALTNLQCVLDQFRKDKEKDIEEATARIQQQIVVEKGKQDELLKEIGTLKQQLEESKQGLQAASRLTNQMEKFKHQTTTLKEEVTKLQDKLTKAEDNCKSLSTQTETRVDKALIKNLVIGLVTNIHNLSKDQNQILKIIATVLDFNQDDNEKVHLNKQMHGSWLNSILHPSSDQPMTHQSLSAAFVRFLETESQPKVLLPLLDVNPTKSGESSVGGPRPLVMSEVVLPTFADFAQNRNSSSILKDVLKEN